LGNALYWGEAVCTSKTFKGAIMTEFRMLTRDGMVPVVSRPAAEKVLAGDPIHSTWNTEEREGLHCGQWQSTPGMWRVQYTEWEYMHILQGVSVVTDAAGTATNLRAGDSFVIRPGFVGTWEVIETTLKDYVIVE
jgi:uncharacterized protein